MTSPYDPRPDEKKYAVPVAYIGGGGEDVELYDIGTVTENGQYPVPQGYDGYDGFEVDVPIPVPALGTKSISANGSYSAEDDQLDGYSSVSVDVEPTLGTKTITANGTYSADDDQLEGYSEIIVSVSPEPRIYPINMYADDNPGIPISEMMINGEGDSSKIKLDPWYAYEPEATDLPDTVTKVFIYVPPAPSPDPEPDPDPGHLIPVG